MNKLFKTLWSESRQTYVVTNETQRTHGKPKTCVLAVAVTLSALCLPKRMLKKVKWQTVRQQ